MYGCKCSFEIEIGLKYIYIYIYLLNTIYIPNSRLQVINAVSMWRKNSHSITVYSCSRTHLILFISGCADLCTTVFYQPLTPEKRTNYPVFDWLFFFVGKIVSKIKFWRNLAKVDIFDLSGPKRGKTSFMVKRLLWC